MNYTETEWICVKVKQIKRRFDNERDPFALCRDLGIALNPVNFGERATSPKAMIVQLRGVKCISYNINLPPEILRPVLFHEIGHGVLHKIGAEGLTDFAVSDDRHRKELQANLFCAEYMLEDREVIETLQETGTLFRAAQALCVPPEIVEYKLRILREKGYGFAGSPFYTCADFWKTVGANETSYSSHAL